MEDLRAYILSVTAAAIICAIVLRLLGKKGTAASVGKMLTGLFLLICVISPLRTLELGDLSDLTADFQADAQAAAAAGQASTKSALAERIKSMTQAYILDKAENLNAQLTVEVILSDDDIPMPIGAHLSGSVSPYAKAQLQQILENDLGIPKEKQVWT